jgi:hypothetical protein
MSKVIRISILVFTLLGLMAGIVQAQEDGERGYIEGRIHRDVNGDGKCVDTGVAGEDPIANINVQFTSSDSETVITNYSGPSGYYGLAAAGYSYWEITVLPGPEWTVTSAPTIYVPIFADSRSATDVHFCLSKGGGIGGATGRVVVNLLPESGGAASSVLAIAAVAGVGLLVAGIFLEWRRRSA